MASVDYRKCKSGDAAAILRHCDRDERMRHEHSNPHIDKSLTPGNMQVRGYATVMRALRERLEELDSRPGANRRKDRVELFMLEVPVPAGHEPKAFMEVVLDEIAGMYGPRNVLGWYLHVDEVHEYVDHGEVKTSLPHIHVPVVPEINGRLNGKVFSSRANMVELNKRIDRRAREIGPPFLTGGHPRKRSVEELKVQSYKSAREEALRAAQRVRNAAGAAEIMRERLEDLKEQVRELERLLERREAEVSIDDRLHGAEAELTLRNIRRDHPQLFDARGKYKRVRPGRDGQNLTL